jgi:hypothetical protein
MEVKPLFAGQRDDAFNTWVRRRWSKIVVEDEETQKQKRLRVQLSQMEMH